MLFKKSMCSAVLFFASVVSHKLLLSPKCAVINQVQKFICQLPNDKVSSLYAFKPLKLFFMKIVFNK